MAMKYCRACVSEPTGLNAAVMTSVVAWGSDGVDGVVWYGGYVV